jgi:hypothetical protein
MVECVVHPKESGLRQHASESRRKTILRIGTVSDWTSCYYWMLKYNFLIGILLFDTPEEVMKYFKSVFLIFPSRCVLLIIEAA